MTDLEKELQEALRKVAELKTKIKETMGPPNKVYFFGCAKPFSEGGHYLYWRPFYEDYELNKTIPWKLGELDGGLAPVTVLSSLIE